MEKVLLIDNDEQIVNLMAKWLTEDGYELAKMYTPKNLLSKIYDFDPAVVILGISLHGTDGRHFCSLLKTIERTKNIKIIIMSPKHNHYEVEDYEWCADAFLYEPHTQEKLLKAVNGVLNRQLTSH